MAWTAPSTQVTGTLITATIYNDQIINNLLETAPAKVTTAGDLVQATGANALARLAVVANRFLRGNAAGNAVEYSTINEDANGALFINDTTNVDMTQGLTVDQGANDDEILALKSSGDVAHGMTSIAETDTYLAIKKVIGANGIAEITGLSSAARGVVVRGLGTADVTAKTTAATGYVELRAGKKSGATIGDAGANANLVVIRNNSTARWILDAEGDIFYGGADDGTITDKHDDIPLLMGLRAIVSPKNSPAKNRFKDKFKQLTEGAAEDILVQQGVLSAPISDGGLVSTKGLNGLMMDAMNQLYGKIRELEARLEKYEGAA